MSKTLFFPFAQLYFEILYLLADVFAPVAVGILGISVNLHPDEVLAFFPVRAHYRYYGEDTCLSGRDCCVIDVWQAGEASAVKLRFASIFFDGTPKNGHPQVAV